MPQIHCIASSEYCDHGQPIWVESQQSLFWVENTKQYLYQYHEPSGEITHCALDAPILSLSPRINNGFIATLEDGIGLYDMKTRQVTYISKPEPFSKNKQTIAGITDNYGNFWSFTQTGDNLGDSGKLYQLNSDMNLQRVAGNSWRCSAPPAFSKDGSILYQSAGKTRYVYATRLNEQRQPIETNSFCRISKSDGYPHGLCVDSEDCLWICHRTMGYISRYNKEGDCLEKIKIPAPGVKFCTFGGINMDKLFIVTAGHEDLLRTRKNIKLVDAIAYFEPGVAGLSIKQFAG